MTPRVWWRTPMPTGKPSG